MTVRSFVENGGYTSTLWPRMTHTIRIKKGGPRSLHFEVDSGAGRGIATSASFDTICLLEAGLSVLVQAAQSPSSVAVEFGAGTTSLGPSKRRMRVRFVGHLDADGIREVLAGALTAVVVDERPSSQRRANLSGRLCDLDH